MKLPKALLGAMLVGITVHATSCTKNGDPQPKSERGEKNGKETAKTPVNCPACGMG
ncbi:chryseobasin-related MNIO class RiPP peptide [Hymenobacter crusticola]